MLLLLLVLLLFGYTVTELDQLECELGTLESVYYDNSDTHAYTYAHTHVQTHAHTTSLYYSTYTYVSYTHGTLAKSCSKTIENRSTYSNRTIG